MFQVGDFQNMIKVIFGGYRQPHHTVYISKESFTTVQLSTFCLQAVQNQLQIPPTTPIQLVTLQQPLHTGNNSSQPKQPIAKPATPAAPQHMTSPPATPSLPAVSTVASSAAVQVALAGNMTGNQHQSPYAMRSRSQSKQKDFLNVFPHHCILLYCAVFKQYLLKSQVVVVLDLW